MENDFIILSVVENPLPLEDLVHNRVAMEKKHFRKSYFSLQVLLSTRMVNQIKMLGLLHWLLILIL